MQKLFQDILNILYSSKAFYTFHNVYFKKKKFMKKKSHASLAVKRFCIFFLPPISCNCTTLGLLPTDSTRNITFRKT